MTFHWRPEKKKRILYQLDHRGVCLAAEITEKQPMTRPRCEDRPRRPPKASKQRFEGQKKKSERWKQRGDLPPVGFTPCSNLREDYSFFHHSFLFIYSISKFISNSPEGGETKYQAKRINTVRANG